MVKPREKAGNAEEEEGGGGGGGEEEEEEEEEGPQPLCQSVSMCIHQSRPSQRYTLHAPGIACDQEKQTNFPRFPLWSFFQVKVNWLFTKLDSSGRAALSQAS